ncbi:MAG TPA: hypothetical protein VGK59_23855 [Ohtaekwangia sp.]
METELTTEQKLEKLKQINADIELIDGELRCVERAQEMSESTTTVKFMAANGGGYQFTVSPEDILAMLQICSNHFLSVKQSFIAEAKEIMNSGEPDEPETERD